jgi:hypothetical protein
MCSRMSHSSILSLLHTFVPLLAPLATLPPFGMLTSAGTTMQTTRAPGTRSARYPSKLWVASAPVPCSSSAKQPMPHFPSPDTSVPPASPTCTANSPWCSAGTCPACLRRQRAYTPHTQVPAGSVARPMPPQRLCTEASQPAAMAAGFCLRLMHLPLSPQLVLRCVFSFHSAAVSSGLILSGWSLVCWSYFLATW